MLLPEADRPPPEEDGERPPLEDITARESQAVARCCRQDSSLAEAVAALLE